MPPGWLCETTSLLIGGAAVGSGIMGGTRRAHKPQRLRLQWRTYVSTAALVTRHAAGTKTPAGACA